MLNDVSSLSITSNGDARQEDPMNEELDQGVAVVVPGLLRVNEFLFLRHRRP